MMKLLGKMETKEVKLKNYRKIEKVFCDKCKCELKTLFASVDIHHNRWGNDSCDSYRHYDLCFECAKNFFNEYLLDPQRTDAFEYEVEKVWYGNVEVDENGYVYDDDNSEYKYIENEGK